jgi:hypothetical protein
MSTDFTLEFRGNCVHVRLAADYEITPEGMARHWSALIAFSKEHNCTRVLSEGINPRGRMGTTDAYDSATQAAAGGLISKVACFWEGYVPDELTRFFETVASNRGLSVRFFSTRTEALRWLEADVAEHPP